ncbi:HAD family hydrolase [Leifsonia poae]|uniref:Haloacid dehalogenase n=1 Tax=Leifsonia poae TaxID=110933 RepID=A0A9W6HAE6_9MICO|nr:HAD family hydrolase [Leifsonia poae]GLJ76302.1 haloacid dehalogenase [Leifsonia poae]
MSDLLPSWRDTATKSAIVDFVASVTTGDGTLPPDERVAVFDNDGTLWTEKPMPTQLHFIVMRWAAAAAADPSLADRQPYKAAVTNDLAWLGKAIEKHYDGDDSDLHTMIGAILATTAGESVEEYQAAVTGFYRDAKHLTLGRSYAGAVYKPMIELLRFLEANGFTCYIVSGGDRDFMRPMSHDYYGIPPERVVGSAVGLSFDETANEVRYGNAFSFMDDGPEKPVRIWSRVGRRPALAVGNSNGDMQMLGYASGLGMLVHHDDDTGRGDEPYDAGAERALAAASGNDWTIVSVRDDWSQIFPQPQAADA